MGVIGGAEMSVSEQWCSLEQRHDEAGHETWTSKVPTGVVRE